MKKLLLFATTLLLAFGFWSYKVKPPAIDVVYTWVDGADAAWQQARAEAQAAYTEAQAADSVAPCRFRNHDELKYSLRSLCKFAPFVNHIYIVTCGQVPSWLKSHPKITLVNHKDIFLNKTHLPTFNSHAIESNLHRIPGLSDHFIYFNDDMILSSHVTPDDFFTADGKIKLAFSSSVTDTGAVEQRDGGWHSGWKNTNALLDTLFKKKARKALAHAPIALRRSFIEELEQQFPHLFEAVSAHMFRSLTDYTMTNGFIPYHALYTDRGVKGALRSKTIRLHADEARLMHKIQQVRSGKYQSFCLEDVRARQEESLPAVVATFLEEYFPEKAPWEK